MAKIHVGKSDIESKVRRRKAVKQAVQVSVKNFPIDVVIPWVDSSDPTWRQRMLAYTPSGAQGKTSLADMPANKSFAAGSASLPLPEHPFSALAPGSAKSTYIPEQFRSYDNLRYIFRGIETYMPWVHRIFLLVDQNVPAWLVAEHPRLHVVRHEDFIPAEYLPVFSSNPIELNLHRIPDLAEHFIYFNDDIFVTGPVARTDFFRSGLPCIYPRLGTLRPLELKTCFYHILLNNVSAANSQNDLSAAFRAHASSWLPRPWENSVLRTFAQQGFNVQTLRNGSISSFITDHTSYPMLKSVCAAAAVHYAVQFDRTCSHRFRSEQDVNVYLVLLEHLLLGRSYPYHNPKNTGYFALDADLDALCAALKQDKYYIVCANDVNVADFEATKERLNAALQEKLPKQCSFEKEVGEHSDRADLLAGDGNRCTVSAVDSYGAEADPETVDTGMPLVSIVTPCWNSMPYLEHYLQSLLNQTYPHFEVILVDDGSTDGTAACIHRYKEKFRQRGIALCYFYQTHQNQAAAVRRGLPHATGTYLIWPDSDDVLDPEQIEKEVRFLEAHPEYGFVRTERYYIDAESGRHFRGRECRPADPAHIFEDLLYERVYVCCGCYMLRMSAFERCYPDRQIPVCSGGQNYQMLLPIAYRFACGFIDEPLYGITEHADSHSHVHLGIPGETARLLGLWLVCARILRGLRVPVRKRVPWMARKAYAFGQVLLLRLVQPAVHELREKLR